MSKTAMIRARVEENLKSEVTKVFNKLGLTATEAITLFYRQIKLHNGLPFSVKIPSKTTAKTFKETDEGKNIIKTKNAEDLFNSIEI